MIVDGKDAGFSMKVSDGGFLDVTSADAQSGVLKTLEFGDGRGAGVGVPDRACIVNDGQDERFEGEQKRLSVMAPSSPRQRLQNGNPSGHAGDDIIRVGAKGQRGGKCDAEKLWLLGDGDELTFDENRWMHVDLSHPRSEECHVAFGWFDFEIIVSSPFRDQFEGCSEICPQFINKDCSEGDCEVIRVTDENFSAWRKVVDEVVKEGWRENSPLRHAHMADAEIGPLVEVCRSGLTALQPSRKPSEVGRV